jgi:hypothetical protein
MEFRWTKISESDETPITEKRTYECLGYLVHCRHFGDIAWGEHPEFGEGGDYTGEYALKNAKSDCRKHFNSLNKRHQRKLIKKYLPTKEGAGMPPGK